ncbi:hypothetical protein BDZ90DRAFT_230146 [Jaminaea rosea]|uniref:Uncharacterized protein n=1 Tax=Jaminaea rosea TaxID=1569628 RepID=A0A316V0S2_9BASI|nr:hypothetical protein BDZ90DRAFT_230146 [Jaminaea rosea]PWN31150.1 hypothetical protein BDZ90DRAFT_230146 [Jaminaea rosea]
MAEPRGKKKAGPSNKKGANPLKARLKGQTTAAGEGGASASGSTPGNDRDEEACGPLFEATLSGPLITLLFTSKANQHATLARIEAFYESASQARRYLSLEEAGKARLCQNYEAFNLPLSVAREWLREMRAKEEAGGEEEQEQEQDGQAVWWAAFVNAEEKELLTFLDERGVLTSPPRASSPSYLISSLVTQQSTSLPHERLHALYHLSELYRSLVTDHYSSLTKRARKAIETDLGMRGYGQTVWEDEWQAYVVHGEEEVGGGVAKGENGEARQALRETVREEGCRLGLGGTGFW